MRTGIGFGIAAVALLAGCSVNPIQAPAAGAPTRVPNSTATATAPAPATEPAAGQGAIVPEARTVPPATAALLNQSHAQLDAGDIGGAAATIERALTITPDAAVLWVELAEIRMREGDPDLAEEMARKALTLTADPALAARARRLIRR